MCFRWEVFQPVVRIGESKKKDFESIKKDFESMTKDLESMKKEL